MNGRSLGSNPSLVSEARLRDGRRVVNCDKLLSGSEHDQRREKVRREGGSEDPDAPPGASQTSSSSGYGAAGQILFSDL